MMYEQLVTALQSCGIPFEEIGWEHAPAEGAYGIIALDGAADTMWANDHMEEQALSGSVDLFVRNKGLTEMLTVQRVLAQQGISWRLEDVSYEPARHIMHYEWTFELEEL